MLDFATLSALVDIFLDCSPCIDAETQPHHPHPAPVAVPQTFLLNELTLV